MTDVERLRQRIVMLEKLKANEEDGLLADEHEAQLKEIGFAVLDARKRERRERIEDYKSQIAALEAEIAGAATADGSSRGLSEPRAGIVAHCRKIVARLQALPWGLAHYIQEEARLLPINASPYDEGGSHGPRENLLRRLKQDSRLLVLGEPGIGKTVALERLAWELASADPPTVPVLIKLLEYDGQPLLEWVRLKLIETGELHLKTTEQTSEYLNHIAFDCALLLDGLNEVRPAHREKLVGEITRLALSYPRHQVIVTSRVQDESWRQLRAGSAFAETLVIQPTRPEDARSYLDAHLGSEQSAALWAGLDSRMRELALTPLLLWLIKEAYLEASQSAGGGPVRIPDNWGALYQKFVDRLLRRDDDRGLSRRIPERQRLDALETLALHLHQQQTLTAPRDEVIEQVGGEDILEALLVNGLLMGEGKIRFAPHQTVQEHFAARALEERVMQAAKAPTLSKLARRAGFIRTELEYARDPWWWETFIQLSGLTGEGNALALALADINPWLAWWCFEEGGKFDPSVREKIARQSQALVYSTQASERRAAANALARLNTPRVKDYLAVLSVDSDPGASRTALQALIGMGEDGIRAFLEQFSERIQALSPLDRAAWGRSVQDLDPRQGVGLRIDGLPDIDWVLISDRGEWTYQNGKHAGLPAFRMSRYPITYRQFQAFMDAPDGYRNDAWWRGMDVPGNHRAEPAEQAFKFNNHPREMVSWWEAMAFCRWLSARLGYEVRLPTEQEWERAARYTDGRAYPYGGKFDASKGNTRESGIGKTCAVGLFPDGASEEGVLDLSGNVWEWCLNEYENPDRTGPGGTERRVLRGGGWLDFLDFTRAAFRNLVRPDSRLNLIGFRVVCVPPSQGH